jgi:acetyl esterase/lipase
MNHFGLYTMAAFYIFSGINHFRIPRMYIKLIPPYFPKPKILNIVSGILEIILGLLCILRPSRDLASLGIIILLIAFLPVHFYMISARLEKFKSLPLWALIVRIPLQFVLMAWAALYAFPQWGMLPHTHSFKKHSNVVYKKTLDQKISGDIYLPSEKHFDTAVVVIHGGSWSSRQGDMASICEDLATQGYVTFNITYRLAPQNLYPKSVEDSKDAITWFRSQAGKYNFNPERIVVWGYSAGGHLALMAGFDSRLKILGIIAGGTPADFTLWPHSPIIKKYLGNTLQENQELWREASPINHISEKMPPAFLYHGENDHLVEPVQMFKLAEALKIKSNKVSTLLIPYLGHVAVYLLSQTYFDSALDFISHLD